MRNMPEEVKQAVWDKYAPRKGEEIDPACLYVGPLLDGWTEYMPEVARLVVRSGEDNPLGIRHRIKRLILDVVNPEPTNETRVGEVKTWQASVMPSLNTRGARCRPGIGLNATRCRQKSLVN